MATKADVIEWVVKSLAGENLRNHEIRITGNTGKDQGYIGDIVFVTVNGTTEDGKPKTLDLVVKHEKDNALLRNTYPTKTAFDNEIFIYDEVMPIFHEFQSKRNVTGIFDSIPKCYYTVTTDDMEALIMDNMKAKGYEHLDRKKAVDLNHCKKILMEYGKLHAISFAMQKHEPETFSVLRNGLSRFDALTSFYVSPAFRKSEEKAVLDILEILKGRQQLYDDFSKLFNRNPCDIALEIYKQEPSQSVVTHGDCWSNNFMFKYEAEDRATPAKVAILDWQMSRVTSPVFDLSYFLYGVCSQQELDHFEDLLKVYYDSLVQHSAQMDCNVQQVFSYQDLKEHWKKYSITGLIIAMVVLKLALVDEEEAISFNTVSEDTDVDSILDGLTYTDLYCERIVNVLAHYFASTT